MKISEFATCTVAYNDEKLIGGMLEGVKDLYNLVIIGRPWRGQHIEFDSSYEIAKRMRADVLLQDFNSEKEERNFGLEYLQKKGFKYAIILDTDEYYLKEDIYKLMKYVSENDIDAYQVKNAKVYWKDWKYNFQHVGGITCIKTDKRFHGKRELSKEYSVRMLPNEIVCHHFSFSVSLDEMYTKANTREYSILTKSWVDTYWKNWTPGQDYKEFRIRETTNIPSEILGRYIKSTNLLY
jgi:hypothetical protein